MVTTWFTQDTQGHFLQYLAPCKQILVGWYQWEERYGLTFLTFLCKTGFYDIIAKCGHSMLITAAYALI